MRLGTSKKRNSVVALLLYSITAIASVEAADLSFSPQSQLVEEGRPFVVSIEIDRNDTIINGVAGKMVYPSDLLKVVSVSKNSSIIQMWSQEPDFRTEIGKTSFEGIVLNPGFSGGKGLIYKVSFLPLATGTATVSFSSGNIYANDGEATDVLSSLGKATFTIKEKRGVDVFEEVKESVKTNSNVQNDMYIVSPTHPREDSWYKERNVLVNLLLGSKATDISYSFGHSGDLVSRQRIGATSSLSFLAKKDGIHEIKVKQKVGGMWKPDSFFTVKIDSEHPYDVTAKPAYGGASSKVFQTVELGGKDSMSGISYFTLQLNVGSVRTVKADVYGNASAPLPKASFGKNTLSIAAYDFANNKKTFETQFSVIPLDAPLITAFAKTISQGEVFTIYGSTYPLATVKVILSGEKAIYEKLATANVKGEFSVSDTIVVPGVYEIKSMVLDFEGGQSPFMTPGNVKVNYSLFFFLSNSGLYTLLYALCLLFIAGLASIATRHVMKKSVQKYNEEARPRRKRLKHFFAEENIKALKEKAKNFLSDNEV